MKKKSFMLFLTGFMVAYANPSWIQDPTQHGVYNGSVGCAKKMQDKKMQLEIAKLRAKASLSATKEVAVNTTTQSFESAFDTDFSTSSKQNANALLITEIKEQFIDKDGTLCVWMIEKKEK